MSGPSSAGTSPAISRRSSFAKDAGATLKIGLCAMEKKTKSKPMRMIMDRLKMCGDFEIITFEDNTILNEPVENWPICDCFIAFFSTGFPLAKAKEYSNLRRPFCLNDLSLQDELLDRRKVYEILVDNGVSVPRYAVLEEDNIEQDLVEHEDYIEIRGMRFNKPFVEKPVSGEDHNICIYYPRNAGGGSQRLFRKVGDRSSQFYPDVHTVRRNGSYIYEDFLATEGTDVKVYTVGPMYAHAEARKSPVVDGKVSRDADGKEIRYPIMLTPEEKDMARKVCIAFRQMVCGFDLLRTGEKSFVCDVNGWSFVKSSSKYYDDCASVLRDLILLNIAPNRLNINRPPKGGRSFITLPETSMTESDKALLIGSDSDVDDSSLSTSGSTTPILMGTSVPLPANFTSANGGLTSLAASSTTSVSTPEELRCVIAVIRHGDRTPKQKLKFIVTNEKFLHFFSKYSEDNKTELKLKTAVQLQELLDVTRSLLSQHSGDEDSDIEERFDKLLQMKAVLEKGGHFSGINRKVQLKPTRWVKRSKRVNASAEFDDVAESTTETVAEALLILKWGGELTHAGRVQAEALGHSFREDLYPGEGTGLLRLHATYRHDLKIYSSDEGRVQMTAAAFSKGFLDLEGKLTPILVSLVRKDKAAIKLLDEASPANEDIAAVKSKIHSILSIDKKFDRELIETAVPTLSQSMIRSLQLVRNPTAMCTRIHNLIQVTTDRLRELMAELPMVTNPPTQPNPSVTASPTSAVSASASASTSSTSASSTSTPTTTPASSVTTSIDSNLCNAESLSLMYKRWEKLLRDFFNKKKMRFDMSKIPDIYDCAKYDILHNRHLNLKHMRELYICSKALADFVIPSEYGMTADEKRLIGSKICATLCSKILADFGIASAIPPTGLVSNGTTAAATPSLLPVPPENFSNSNSGEAVLIETSTKKAETDGNSNASAANNPPPPAPPTSNPSSASAILSPASSSANIPSMSKQPSFFPSETVHRLDSRYAQNIKTPDRQVRTRLYFTSESHMHSLLNVLRFSNIRHSEEWNNSMAKLSATSELDYLTHIVFRLYERFDVDPGNPERFRIELLFSPGAVKITEAPTDTHVAPVPPAMTLNSNITLQEMEEVLSSVTTYCSQVVKSEKTSVSRQESMY